MTMIELENDLTSLKSKKTMDGFDFSSGPLKPAEVIAGIVIAAVVLGAIFWWIRNEFGNDD